MIACTPALTAAVKAQETPIVRTFGPGEVRSLLCRRGSFTLRTTDGTTLTLRIRRVRTGPLRFYEDLSGVLMLHAQRYEVWVTGR